jgi:16S rRNA (guanine(1405)-N(7))-methyltransferase
VTPDSEQLADALLRSRRYRHIARPVALRIAAGELRAAGGSFQAALKRSKRRLHQIYGAFMPRLPRYDAWRAELARARGDAARLREAALAILREHASTRERARDLAGFYGALFARVPPPQRVLDAACGLHPLALPWMGLPEGASYCAFDIDEALVAFLRDALAEFPVRPEAFVADLACPPPLPRADLALLLKSLPCLEAQLGDAALAAVAALPARVVAVSFPAHSLGGRRRRLGEHHAARFERAAAQRGWQLDCFRAAGELVFLVQAGAPREPQP